MAVFDNMNYTYSQGLQAGMMEDYHQRALLKNMMPELVHARDAKKFNLPEGNGKYSTFRRFVPLGADTVPLTEGHPKEGQTLEQTKFSVMVKPYGGHMEFTDELNLYHLDNTHQAMNKLLSDQAALSLDTVTRDAYNSGLNVQYAGGKTSRSALTAADIVTLDDIKKARRTLERKNIKPFSDGFYHMIVHPDTYYDLTRDQLWIDVARYQDKQKVEKYELGTIWQVKLFKSTNAKIWKPIEYLYGDVESITTTSAFNVIDRSMEASGMDITPDEGRELAGKLVYIQYDSVNLPMVIERVDVSRKKLYFRWTPSEDVVAKLVTGVEIVPPTADLGSVDVYSNLIYGDDALGMVDLGGNGGNVQMIVNMPGSSGANDPYRQRGTIAWKVKGYAAAIINEDAVVRLESGATA